MSYKYHCDIVLQRNTSEGVFAKGCCCAVKKEQMCNVEGLPSLVTTMHLISHLLYHCVRVITPVSSQRCPGGKSKQSKSCSLHMNRNVYSEVFSHSPKCSSAFFLVEQRVLTRMFALAFSTLIPPPRSSSVTCSFRIWLRTFVIAITIH